MNKAEKKEIRRALCGRMEPAEDGRLIVLPADDLRILGVGDGAGSAGNAEGGGDGRRKTRTE